MAGALGHIEHKDSRDGLFGVRPHLKKVTTLPDYRIHQRGHTLDQGREGACVGFGWSAWHNCKPVGYMNQIGNEYAFGWYHRAQQLDPWPGTDYEGTTVRAGAKVAAERDLLDTYVWAQDIEDVKAWILAKGPLVVASTWYHSMDDLTSDNFVRVYPDSGKRGGHCYMLFGYKSDVWYFQNSWGDGYADGGTFYMRTDALRTLFNVGQFEAVTALQTKAA